MQVIFEVFCTFASAMAIINAEDLYIRPVLNNRQFIHWMNNIQNNGYPVFIILSNQSNICIGTKRFDCSECLVRDFTILEIREAIIKRCQRLLLPSGFTPYLLAC
jgi:hypothetical protein